MAERQGEHAPSHSDEHGDDTTFKREGPEPAGNDTGDSVEEMNRLAEESMRRNIRPDAAGTTGDP